MSGLIFLAQELKGAFQSRSWFKANRFTGFNFDFLTRLRIPTFSCFPASNSKGPKTRISKPFFFLDRFRNIFEGGIDHVSGQSLGQAIAFTTFDYCID